MTRSMRQEYFAQKFGFDCGCEICALSGPGLAKSDARQQAITSLTASITASSRPPYTRTRTLVNEVIRLMQEEEMPSTWTRKWVVRALMSAAEEGHHQDAGYWTRAAAACVRTAGGADCAEYLSITGAPL